MDEKLLRFFKKIGYNDAIAFENASLRDMIINRKEHSWLININATEIININSVMNLKKLCKDGIDDVKKIEIRLFYETLSEEGVLEYFLYFIDQLIESSPSLSSIDKDKIHIDGEIIVVEVLSKIEETTLKRECKKIFKKMEELGITGYEVSFVINEEEREEIKRIIEKTKTEVKVVRPVVQENKENSWKNRVKVDYQREGVVPISSIDREENAVNLEAYIFDAEFNQLTKKDGSFAFSIDIVFIVDDIVIPFVLNSAKLIYLLSYEISTSIAVEFDKYVLNICSPVES